MVGKLLCLFIRAVRAPVVLVLGAGLLMGGGALADGGQRFVTIGTGGVTGVYYPVGSALCRVLNRTRDRHGIRCSAEATSGSIFNIDTIRAGTLDFAFSQSDWLHHAVNGSAAFEDKGPYAQLRLVMPLHTELVTVIARAGRGIRTLDDLKGRSVSIGSPGSGSAATWAVIERQLGWSRQDLEEAAELRSPELASALCSGRVDAYVVILGHPAALVEETRALCDVVYVDVAGAAIDRLVAEHPYYRKGSIPAGTYGNDSAIETVGVTAMLFTGAAMPDAVVDVLVHTILDHAEDLKTLHTALAGLNLKEAASRAVDVTWHPAAAALLQAEGVLPSGR